MAHAPAHAPHAPHGRSVYELLQARAADPQVGRLLQQLDALSARLSLAAAAAGEGAARGGAPRSVRSVPLPAPPGRRGGAPLPPFDWAPASEHAALQAAADAATAGAPGGSGEAARVWRGWALTPENAARVLELAWWAVAALFQPGHPGSAALQRHVVASLSRHYVSRLLPVRPPAAGRGRAAAAAGDARLRVWARAAAGAAAALLAAAFPGDPELAGGGAARVEARLRHQLRLWTTGSRAGMRGDGREGDQWAARLVPGHAHKQYPQTPNGPHTPLPTCQPGVLPGEAPPEGEGEANAGAGAGCRHDEGDDASLLLLVSLEPPEAGARVEAAGLRSDTVSAHAAAARAKSAKARAAAAAAPETATFATCAPGPLMAQALAAQRLGAGALQAGRRKVCQDCVVASSSGGGRERGRTEAAGPGAGSGLLAPAAVQDGARGNASGSRGFAARAAACVSAARAAEGAYTARRAALRSEVLSARRAGQRQRRQAADAAGATAGLAREGRRRLGDAIAGLTGGSGGALAGAAQPVAGGGGGGGPTDAECKAQRVRARLEWRRLDWRVAHRFNPFAQGHSLELAAALHGKAGGGGGGGGWSEALRGVPVGRGRGTARVRVMKVARGVLERLARERAERGRPP
jgi:hypothetical protein